MVGVGKGPRPYGGGDADDGVGRERHVTEEHMGSGDNMDIGGMSEEGMSVWAHGHMTKGTWATWTMGVDARSAWTIGFRTGTVWDISHVSQWVDGRWVASVCMGHGRDTSNMS